MNAATRQWVERALDKRITSSALIQSLWSGYGAIWRCQLDDGSQAILKAVTPPPGEGLSHQRKLRSYAVETHWYATWAARTGQASPVPAVLALDATPGAWRLLLQDVGAPAQSAPSAHLDWLAHFHAAFMGQNPEGLWPMGCYWHLQTRPEEHARQAPGPLKDAAQDLDARLNAARFKTLVHGDAKAANFCSGPQGLRAVDFQYVGGGCGMKDVAYWVSRAPDPANPDHLSRYFSTLRAALTAADPQRWSIPMLDELESEWRALYPVAWADYCRFLAGWAPSRRQDDLDREMIARALRAL